MTDLALAELRADEMARCLPGELSTWPDGRDRAALARPLLLQYHHAGAPAGLTEALVLASLRSVAAAWAPCGVPIEVLRAPADQPAPPPRQPAPAGQAIPVAWDDAAAGGAFGLANLGLRRLALGVGAFTALRSRQPPQGLRHTLDMVLAHEVGHLLGLVAHSRRCIDVMSYYDNGQGERCRARDPRGPTSMPPGTDYRAPLPTACDLARCRAVNAPGQPAAAR